MGLRRFLFENVYQNPVPKGEETKAIGMIQSLYGWYLDHVLETLLIAVVAFPLAYLSSKQGAGTLGTMVGKRAGYVIVTPQHFILVATAGGLPLVAAVLVSGISAMPLRPRQILAQMA